LEDILVGLLGIANYILLIVWIWIKRITIDAGWILAYLLFTATAPS
jgi:hypothetical protein